MKGSLSSVVREYNFDSVQAFYKELNTAKRGKQNYEAACVDLVLPFEWIDSIINLKIRGTKGRIF